jgi:hypothetical protein
MVHKQTNHTIDENTLGYGGRKKQHDEKKERSAGAEADWTRFLHPNLPMEASTKTASCRILQTDNQVREGAFLVRHLEAVSSGRMLDCSSTRAVRGARAWPSCRCS